MQGEEKSYTSDFIELFPSSKAWSIIPTSGRGEKMHLTSSSVVWAAIHCNNSPLVVAWWTIRKQLFTILQIRWLLRTTDALLRMQDRSTWRIFVRTTYSDAGSVTSNLQSVRASTTSTFVAFRSSTRRVKILHTDHKKTLVMGAPGSSDQIISKNGWKYRQGWYYAMVLATWWLAYAIPSMIG